jgi:hypothetical protein
LGADAATGTTGHEAPTAESASTAPNWTSCARYSRAHRSTSWPERLLEQRAVPACRLWLGCPGMAESTYPCGFRHRRHARTEVIVAGATP